MFIILKKEGLKNRSKKQIQNISGDSNFRQKLVRKYLQRGIKLKVVPKLLVPFMGQIQVEIL